MSFQMVRWILLGGIAQQIFDTANSSKIVERNRYV